MWWIDCHAVNHCHQSSLTTGIGRPGGSSSSDPGREGQRHKIEWQLRHGGMQYGFTEVINLDLGPWQKGTDTRVSGN